MTTQSFDFFEQNFELNTLTQRFLEQTNKARGLATYVRYSHQTAKWRDSSSDIAQMSAKFSRQLIDMVDQVQRDLVLPEVCPKEMNLLANGLIACMQGMAGQVADWAGQLKSLSQTLEDMGKMFEAQRVETEAFREKVDRADAGAGQPGDAAAELLPAAVRGDKDVPGLRRGREEDQRELRGPAQRQQAGVVDEQAGDGLPKEVRRERLRAAGPAEVQGARV